MKYCEPQSQGCTFCLDVHWFTQGWMSSMCPTKSQSTPIYRGMEIEQKKHKKITFSSVARFCRNHTKAWLLLSLFYFFYYYWLGGGLCLCLCIFLYRWIDKGISPKCLFLHLTQHFLHVSEKPYFHESVYKRIRFIVPAEYSPELKYIFIMYFIEVGFTENADKKVSIDNIRIEYK